MKQIKYRTRFKGMDNFQYVVNIYEDDYIGEIYELQAASNPFVTEEENNPDAFTPVRTQTGFLTLIDEDGSLLDNIAPTSATSHFIELINESNENQVMWQGFLSDEVYTQDYFSGTHEISIALRSPLEVMKHIRISNTWLSQLISVDKIIYDVVLGELYRYTPRSIYEGLYFPYLTSDTNHFLDVILNTSNFFSLKKRKGTSGDYTLIEGVSLYDVIVTFSSFLGLCCQERGNNIYFNELSALAGETNYVNELVGRFGIGIKGQYTKITRLELNQLQYVANNHRKGTTSGFNKVTINASINKIENSNLNGTSLPDFSVQTELRRGFGVASDYNQPFPHDMQSMWYLYALVINFGEQYNAVNFYFTENKTINNLLIRENSYSLKNNTDRLYSGTATLAEHSYSKSLADEIFRSTGDRIVCATSLAEYLRRVAGWSTSYDYEVDMFRRTGAVMIKYDYYHDIESHKEYSYSNALYCKMLPLDYNRDNRIRSTIVELTSTSDIATSAGYFNINLKASFVSGFGNIGSLLDDNSTIMISFKHGNMYWDGNHWTTTPGYFPVTIKKDGSLLTNRQADWDVAGSDGIFIPTIGGNDGNVKIYIHDYLNAFLKCDITAYKNEEEGRVKITDKIPAWDMIIHSLTVSYISNQTITTDTSDTNVYSDLTTLNSRQAKEINTNIATFNNNTGGLAFLIDPTKYPYDRNLETFPYPQKVDSSYIMKDVRPEIHLLQCCMQYYNQPRTWLKVTVRPTDIPMPLLRFDWGGKVFAGISENRNWQKNETEITLTETILIDIQEHED